jgi:Domain of unknown function (DUF4279)
MKTQNKAHRYTVELRLFGTMDPDVVTAETGLQPCDVQRAEIDQEGKMLQKSRWAYNGRGQSGSYEWDTLEEGLEFVLERVSSSVDIFKRYGANQLVTWWCGHFQSSFDGGPILSPRLLKRLADFGADLFIDNYFSREEGTAIGSAQPPELNTGPNPPGSVR